MAAPPSSTKYQLKLGRYALPVLCVSRAGNVEERNSEPRTGGGVGGRDGGKGRYRLTFRPGIWRR